MQVKRNRRCSESGISAGSERRFPGRDISQSDVVPQNIRLDLPSSCAYNPLMFIRVKAKTNGAKAVQIVESSRRNERVIQTILRHVGIANNDQELADLRNLAQGILQHMKKERFNDPGQRALFNTEENEAISLEECGTAFERVLEADEGPRLGSGENEARVADGPFEVTEWIFSNMGLNRIFTNTKRDGAKIGILKQCVAGMLASPSSKRSLSGWLAEYSTHSPSLDSIYRFMDAFIKKKSKILDLIRKNSESLCSTSVNLALYDVTTLYFESVKEDDLRQSGYSKDNKFKETQVVLALATTPDGLPLWYETYPGKTWEGGTLKDFVSHWKKNSVGIDKGVVAADSAMFSKANLSELKESGLHYALGAPLKKLPTLERKQVLDRSGYKSLKRCSENDEKPETMEYRVIQRPDGTLLLVTWSSARAEKNARDRERLLERTLKKLEGRGKVRGASILGNRGTLKYLKLLEGQEANEYILDEEKIADDAQWDGLRGVITDLPVRNEREASEVLSHYHSLWRIEESFRINKSDLKIRPIYHWTQSRIEAHILLCYLVFACLRYLQRRVLIQQKEKMSAKALMKAILDIDSNIFRDLTSGKAYRLPKHLSPLSKKLYQALGIKHDTRPRELLRISQYYERSKLPKRQSPTESE